MDRFNLRGARRVVRAASLTDRVCKLDFLVTEARRPLVNRFFILISFVSSHRMRMDPGVNDSLPSCGELLPSKFSLTE